MAVKAVMKAAAAGRERELVGSGTYGGEPERGSSHRTP